MKGRHEHHKHRETGGVNEAEEDRETRPERYDNAPKIEGAAEERKHGGKTERRKRAHGGEVHHSSCKCHKCMGGAARKRGGEAMEHKKVVEVHGEHERHHAGRKPRKDGGRTGADEHPFSSAHKGEQPAAHKAEIMD
jgi:hypothetical protein